MPRLALVGNLSHDLVDGGPPRVGGAPIHCARALRLLGTRATIVARCGVDDAGEFRRAFARLGFPVRLVLDGETTAFAFHYEGDRRIMRVERLGEAWTTADVTSVPSGAWVHVAPLLAGDFSADVVRALSRGRRVSFDGQGLTRARAVGPLRLEDDRDDELLRNVSILKLAEEEAEALAGSLDPEALAALGPPEVVVTFGSRGSLVVSRGVATRVHARHVAADPTGSGDAFAISYLASRAAGLPPVASARRATGLVAALLSGARL